MYHVARTLDQILGELGSTYDPQIAQIRQRQGLIPGQIAEEEKGLQAKQTQAFDDILGGARRRGLGFSGIPVGEQARYTSTEFLPALARLKQTGREQAMSLEDAILGIQERRNTLGQQLYQSERDRAEQIRQFNENLAFQREQAAVQRRAAVASAINPTLFAPTQPSRPSLDEIFGQYNRNTVPLNVTQARGSTIPLNVSTARPKTTISGVVNASPGRIVGVR